MSQQTFHRLAVATAVATYGLLVLGGAVKAYGAGLACPDWPLCYGQLIPPLDSLVLLEWGHRLGALVVSLLAVATAVAAWRTGQRTYQMGAGVALGLLAVQVVLGGLTVLWTLPPAIVASHLAVATAFFATWLTLAVRSGLQPASPAPGEDSTHHRGGALGWLPHAALATVYVTMVLGSYMKSAGAGLACPDWPLCGAAGSGPLVWIHLGHRLAAVAAGGLILYLGPVAWRRLAQRPLLRGLALLVVGLLVVQVLFGALAVQLVLPPAVVVTHLAVAEALTAALVVLVAALHPARISQSVPSAPGEVASGGGGAVSSVAPMVQAPGEEREGTVATGGGGAAARAPAAVCPSDPPCLHVTWARFLTRLPDYLQLMKPRIVLLLLITGYTAMWVAAGGPPPWRLAAATLLGLALSSGGANALNMWWDRDIDAVMARTRRRPIPAGRVSPDQALFFGIGLGILSTFFLAALVNLTAAVLSLAGYLFYVLVYTMWLKRSTAQNIVIGGAAGAVPPLVGWAAVTGQVSLPALVMFLIVFLWTPPHFWALALFRNEDYRRAGVPMLPVVRGEAHTKWQIFAYAVLMIPVSLLLYWTGVVGPFYLWTALVLGAWLVAGCVALLRERLPQQRWAHRVFGWSILYLGLVFLAMILDVRL